MTDIQARLADINARAAPVLDDHLRLIGAINKAITLILTVAMVGVLYVAVSMADEHYRIEALKCQEACVRHG